MIYLALFVVVAGAGIGWLWFVQKRERSTLDTVDQFRTGLQKISEGEGPVHPTSGVTPGPRTRRNGSRPEPLDPARRAAAKQRIAVRRAARSRSVG